MCLAVLKNAKAPGGHLLHNSSALEQQLSERSCTEPGPEVKPSSLRQPKKSKLGKEKKIFE